MKIKTYNSNWEIFFDDGYLSICTDLDYINSNFFDSLEDVATYIAEKIEENGYKMTNDDKEYLLHKCNIDFTCRF